ncbi:MAG: Gfo/Idh/MocA family oxidoreductase, partial [Myxococcota bacterium]
SSLARSKGLRLAASPGQVLLPAYRRATEIIRSGELGDLVSIDASAEASAHRYEEERADENPPPDRPFSWQWYHSAAKGGGPLDDMFVYPLAFLTALFGSATSAAVKHRLVVPHIEWKGRQVAADAPDAFCGLLMFQEIPTTFRSSFSSNTRRVPWGFISIRGTDAALEIEKCNDLEYRLHLRTNEGASHTESHDVFSSDEVHLYGKKECHVLTDLMEFFSAVKDQRDVRGATATNAAQVAQTLSLMKASARADGAWHNADHEGREQR